MSIRVAIHGANGHQIHNALASHPLARLVAIAEFPREMLPAPLREDPSIRVHPSLEGILEDAEVDLVSLCSPRRGEQAAHAIKALRAGKHVYAEKPCALNEADLDAIIHAAKEAGRSFHEMAGTAFGQPYLAMRRIVAEGRIGEVVQVIAEKSYPYHDDRPQDEEVDGGLIGQNAIHAVRLVEHAAGVRISSIQATETALGNPVSGGGLQMAASLICNLENGGVASIAANYLNPRGTKIWGDESLRILGTRGMIESTRGGAQTRLVVESEDCGPLSLDEPSIDYFDLYLKTLSGHGPMPLTMEEELSATRWVIRAKAAARRPFADS